MFQIQDKHELLALHRALMEVIHGIQELNDKDIQGSPFVASVANRVLDTLIRHEEGEGNHDIVSRWLQWRELTDDRREWKLLVDRIKQRRGFAIPEANKESFIRSLASPFVLSESQRTLLLEILNEKKE